MNITLQLSRDFERCLEDLKKKYGEDFEYINGLHPSQLDFSEFIDNFVDKDTLADASIDPNANANHKDIRSFMTEKTKSEDKLFAMNKIFLTSASNNARGHAFNEVLYEEGIDEEILHVVVQPTEKLYTFQKQWINATNPWNAVENTWNNAPVYWWMRDTAGKTNYLDYIDQRNYGLFV